MTRLSEGSKNALCGLSATADMTCADIIGRAHTAYFNDDNLGSLLIHLRGIRSSFSRLSVAIACVDNIIDELEGRKPVVPVDEQRAA